MRAIIAAMGLAAAACAQAPGPVAPPSPVESPRPAGSISAGLRMSELVCAQCHAIGQSGESPVAEAPAFRRLAERYPVTLLEEAFAEGLLTGHPAMPEFRFSESEIEDLLAYIQSIQERQGG